MKRITLVAVILVLFASISHSEARWKRGQYCKNLRGFINTTLTNESCKSDVFLCTEGQTSSAGMLKGQTFYTTVALGPTAADGTFTSSVSYTGYLTINTKHGQLRIIDLGLLDNVGGSFTEMSLDISGDGIFRNATGKVFFFGDATGTGFKGEIDGTLCFQKEFDGDL